MAAELGPDLVIFEGSGAALPPIDVAARVLVAGGAQDPEIVAGYLGAYRILVSDLVVLTGCEAPLVSAGQVERLREAIRAVKDVPVIATAFRLQPVEPIEGKRVALFTTAPAGVHDALRAGLERDHGAEVLAVSGNLSRREALREDLELAEVRAADAYVVEIKAAAIDVVAEDRGRAGGRDGLRRQHGRSAGRRAEPRRGARAARPRGGAMNDRRPPESPVLSADTLLPFSKGLMARALMGTGIAPERAYELARFVEVGLSIDHPDLVAPSDAVYDVAAAVLSEHEDEGAVRRLRRYQRLQEVESPLVLLVGGATGTGKSTITTEVAHRLGINRVTSTDFVRQTMRAFFSDTFMPSIHYSSFEAGAAVAAPGEDPSAANIRGFLEQTRNVLVGVRASVERALTEGHSMAIEGVHLVPGLVPSAIEGAIVCQCVIAIPDEETHARHFYVRDVDSEGLRPVRKYLDALPEIRRIQDLLIERAHEAGVPVIENRDREQAVDAVLQFVLDTFERVSPQVRA